MLIDAIDSLAREFRGCWGLRDLLREAGGFYACHFEAPKPNTPLREGQHKGLIRCETFKRIQNKLNGKSTAPPRQNVSLDCPLCGYVLRNDC